MATICRNALVLSSLAAVSGFSSSGSSLRLSPFDASRQLKLRASLKGATARPSSHVLSVSLETSTQAADEFKEAPATPAFRGKSPVLTADGAFQRCLVTYSS